MSNPNAIEEVILDEIRSLLSRTIGVADTLVNDGEHFDSTDIKPTVLQVEILTELLERVEAVITAHKAKLERIHEGVDIAVKPGEVVSPQPERKPPSRLYSPAGNPHWSIANERQERGG